MNLTRSEFLAKLDRFGKCIGSGGYGAVYSDRRSEDTVFKVSTSCDPDGWVAYVAAVADRLAGNPYVPKVHWLRWYTDVYGVDFYVAKMERLTPVTFDDPDYCRVRDVLSPPSIPEISDPLLEEAVFVIKEMTEYWFLDLHDGNMLKRGDQIVITDPFSCPKRLYNPYHSLSDQRSKLGNLQIH